MRCYKCKHDFPSSSMIRETPDGAGNRVNPVCTGCHEDAVRGMSRALTGARFTKVQHYPGYAKDIYDGNFEQRR